MFTDDLTVVEFPPRYEETVYIFLYEEHGKIEPFYVGQTRFFLRRMDDYLGANFKAQADFKVGEAIKYLKDVKGVRILVGHKQTGDRLREEKRLILECSEGGPLLNQLPGYDYKRASIEEERQRIHRFCDHLLEARRGRKAIGAHG